MAVVFIAFKSSMLFCCFFDTFRTEPTLGFEVRMGVSRRSSLLGNSPSASRFLLVSSVRDGSIIGHTKPVRGV
jgi:hypothetical protein